jgi:DUF1680 family protein
MVLFGSVVQQASSQEQGGDQILDGIGETDLIARYLLDGNANDRSRNTLNADVRGETAVFVEDERFGRVLSLPGEGGNYLEVPGRAYGGEDTLSVSAWVYLRATEPQQTLFSFGKSDAAHFTCTLSAANENESFRARIVASGTEQGPTAPRIRTERWVHVAVVFDAANKAISVYADGERVGRAENITITLNQVLDRENGEANQLYVGRAQSDSAGLNANLRDLRLYSIALSDEQVSTIRRNGRGGRGALAGDGNRRGRRGRGRRGRGERPTIAAPSAPSPYVNLVSVPDVTVETVVGVLPRLPDAIAGTYRDNADGPAVDVIWPAPADNSEVASAGTYTVTGRIVGSDLQPKATVTVKQGPAPADAPRRALEPFHLGDVVLNPFENGTETPFMKNRDKFFRGLAATNPDSFLYNFRDAFGQPQPEGAEQLGGWDNQTTRLRGHASGHYLSAVAQAYASTSYDERLQANFRQKMEYMIETLYDLSQKSGRPAEPGGPSNDDATKVPPGPGREGYDSNLAEGEIRTDYWNWGTGFISAYPPDQFIMLEQGATYGGSNRQIWAPYYTLHKILAGLLDCYEVGGNEKALEIARGMGKWVHARLSALPTETRISMWNRYIAGEYGGMNEVMARLYRLTNDDTFLEVAKLFDNINFFYGNPDRQHGLAKNVDTIRSKHANQHIPQITGALETYRNTQDPTYYHIADNFWHMATNHYMYSIGGVAGGVHNGECFTSEPDSLFSRGFAPGSQNETCATYNLLKLSRQLFTYDPDAKYMDYYEQGLYNHILASVDEDGPGNTYHVPLNPASQKRFGNGDMSGFSCCNGTAIESSTKLQDTIYFRSQDNSTLYVNLYVPSTVNWNDRNVTVTQRTDFPYADTSRLVIGGSGRFDVMLRVPKWATKGFTVAVNGSRQEVRAQPGTYVKLSREWKNNDAIDVTMPMSFRLSRVMDQPSLASIFYGPIVLAAAEPDARANWRPLTLSADDIAKSISGDPRTLRFQIGDASLKPFYETYDRYSVYFDVTMEPAAKAGQ